MNLQSIATEVLGPVEWIDFETGYLPCPGKHFHTSKNHKRDCRVCLNGAPTVFCFHANCGSALEEFNLKLRRACVGDKIKSRAWTAKEKNDFAKRKRLEELKEKQRRRVEEVRPFILKTPWAPCDIFEDSPVRPPENIEDDRLLALSLFQKDALLWIGQVVERKFFTADEWIKQPPGRFGNFICPSVFKPGTNARKSENVQATPFLVVESDDLDKDQIGAVFQWLRGFMTLRMIVDTGGKSLHGWFNMPDAATFLHLKNILPVMQCDPHLFTPSQPVRMPGVRRGDKWQYILWFEK